MVGAIILAAGSSRRFGDDKRKATLQNGNMLIENTINVAAKTLDSVLVVLRFGDRAFADELDSKNQHPRHFVFSCTGFRQRHGAQSQQRHSEGS